ncbi:MAG TPA: sensor domain-containing diguanylate cyclase [Pyrinomonadaceae bacterium]
MYSLYDSLLAQHPRQLTPIRCAPSTIAQIHRYFEEVVLENSLSALVIENLPKVEERSARETTRVRQLVHCAKNVFLFVSVDDALSQLMLTRGKESREAIVLEQPQDAVYERFVVIADARFSALLASTRAREDSDPDSGDLVVWTFEPDVVYSALEYLMARITAEHPFHASSFASAVRVSMPKATSLHLTLGVTTKLARLLQEQAEREIAVNRIATAIRNSLELEGLLTTAANEVGRALNVKSCAVQVEGELVGDTKCSYYFRSEPSVSYEEQDDLAADVELVRSCLPHSPKTWVIDGDDTHETGVCAQAAVPLVYEGAFVGLILVESDDASRVWADNELLLLHTVADQLTVAVKQAHLFSQMQAQALTDSLTGCYNRRSFELQLERDLHLATRMGQPLSLIMIDLDNFKDINDQAGHGIGDLALRTVAESLKSELRVVDSPARFGGDEFAIILPQADTEGALIVAERLRKRICETVIPGYGNTTASIGLATFPRHAASRDLLVVAADRALYESKKSGRNRVTLPIELDDMGRVIQFDPQFEPAEVSQNN